MFGEVNHIYPPAESGYVFWMISVIVPTYNQTEVLPWLLRSLERQDFRGDLEVLVCDDGSSQDVLKVVSEAARRGRLELRYLWQEHRGYRLPHSKNNGVRCARGGLLLFVESDCIVPRDWVSRHVNAHRKSSSQPTVVGGVRSWVDVELGSQKVKSLSELRKICRQKSVYLDVDRQRRQARTKHPWTACWGFNCSLPKRPEIHFDESLVGWGNDDYELFCRLWHQQGYRAVLDEEIEVHHIHSPKPGSGWNPWTSENSEQIAAYVRSLLTLKRKFNDVDLTEAMWPLAHFRLDPKTGKWKKADPRTRAHLGEAILAAEIWDDGNKPARHH